MGKIFHLIIVSTLSAIAVLYATLSFAVSAEEYRNAFLDFLEIGPATQLNIHAHGHTPNDINQILIDVYTENDLQPFWIENGEPSKRAMEIMRVLKDAGSEGLNPRSYFSDLFGDFLGKKDAADLVRLDMLISIGLTRYIADQREGRLEAREIDPVLFESARSVEVDLKALRVEAFAARDMKAFLEQQAPSFPQYRALRKKLAEYRALAKAGGWPKIDPGETLKPGMSNPRIAKVILRLLITDELPRAPVDYNLFSDELTQAVKRFQRRHNLDDDGYIGKQTIAAMNVPVEQRIMQIVVNMERYRWMKRGDGPSVTVNIAAYRAIAGTSGKIDVSTPVVVGKLRHETPVFSDIIQYVVFNPYWTLPPSIARNETLGKLRKDPNYLKKHDMRMFLGWSGDAKEVDATKIDWHTVSKRGMNKYRIRQEPGPQNALGTLKIIFPNKYDVYLHDTPAQELFKKDKRAFSHGCIRMERPREMASWVLGGEANGWGIERINEVIQSRKRKVVPLKKKIPVHILYRTAYVDPDSDTLEFYEDVYGRDKLLAGAWDKAQPLGERLMTQTQANNNVTR